MYWYKHIEKGKMDLAKHKIFTRNQLPVQMGIGIEYKMGTIISSQWFPFYFLYILRKTDLCPLKD